jgi:hypothetical protein
MLSQNTSIIYRYHWVWPYSDRNADLINMYDDLSETMDGVVIGNRIYWTP